MGIFILLVASLPIILSGANKNPPGRKNTLESNNLIFTDWDDTVMVMPGFTTIDSQSINFMRALAHTHYELRKLSQELTQKQKEFIQGRLTFIQRELWTENPILSSLCPRTQSHQWKNIKRK